MGGCRKSMNWLAFTLLLYAVLLVFPAWGMGGPPPKPAPDHGFVDARGTTVDIQIDGLACPLCAAPLREKLERKIGRNQFEIRVDDGILRIKTQNLKISPAQIEEIIRSSGFTSRGIVHESLH